jgi:hypothetical protein
MSLESLGAESWRIRIRHAGSSMSSRLVSAAG